MKKFSFAMLLILVAVFACSCLVIPIPRGLISFDIDLPAGSSEASSTDINREDINFEDIPGDLVAYIKSFKLKISADWDVTGADPVDFEVYLSSDAYSEDQADLLVEGTFAPGVNYYPITSDTQAAQALLDAIEDGTAPYIRVVYSGFSSPVESVVTVGISGTVTVGM